MIRYNETFQTNVKGKLIARFQLDGQAKPLTGTEDGTNFYFIELNLEATESANIQKVTYLLDEASYWEPERESTDRTRAFAEGITSYGDFLVRVEVRMASGRFVQQALLSEMLEAGHANDSNPKIQQAIAYIRNN